MAVSRELRGVINTDKRNKRTTYATFVNDTYIASTLTLTDAKITDTGFYECHLQQFPDLKTEHYVYVWDKRHLLLNSGGVDRITVKHGQRAAIPCKPTHPDVRVTLKRNNHFTVETSFKRIDT
ncbi:hypothetical protein DAPPUDRAFT_247620 [Daphnia pulex]|uniref:Ig-like domain-containing protein n=1 Tax=Daphnia pulex TaxID=6669 RepID=E9GSU0_DAPPU|nr:hypothetical protein DAPPUDRAFT_247620 [Daphnia pulex]|eukprot:EFX77490.1 hypothetical protein DAPPUDRAFT_247620 [Daphnia pulex]